jgi:hypothetical protein
MTESAGPAPAAPAPGSAVDEDKLRFLLGPRADRLGDLDPDIPEQLEELLAAEFDVDEERLRTLTALAGEVAAEDPPEVWGTARRLMAAGEHPEAVLEQLLFARSRAEQSESPGSPFDGDAYARSLAWLPLPDGERAAAAVVEAVRVVPGIPPGDAVRLAAEELGRDPDDPLAADFLAETAEALTADGGPLAWLSDDRLVHIGDLMGGCVLTHRLSAGERDRGWLDACDLPGLDRLAPLRLPAGDELAVAEPLEPEQCLAWGGPEGWLGGLPAGSLIAVWVEAGGTVHIEALGEEPAADPVLVVRLRAVYDAEIEDAELPATLTEIALGLLMEDRDTFSHPRPPLSELCAAAGLERRGEEVAHEPAFWANAQRLRSIGRALQALDNDEGRTAALRALDAALDPAVPADALREILRGLAEDGVAEFIADELTAGGPGPLDPQAFAGRLIAAARRPGEVSVACWLAAVVAERLGGGVLEAEPLVRRAVEADPGWAPALDRAAWYAFDRGNAAEAARWWRALDEPPALGLAEAERFAAGVARGLGRNDPCWCGSGRKYKNCHLGQPDLPPLPQRLRWLRLKAIANLERSGEEAGGELLALAEAVAAARDPGRRDPEAFRAAAAHPLVAELLLHEGGWFAAFLGARGPLLPPDELALGTAWVGIPRSVYEVLAPPGQGPLRLLDLATGDTLEPRPPVPGQFLSGRLAAAAFLCGRVVPDGGGHQFLGPIVVVPAGETPAVLLACTDRDPIGLVQHLVGPR